MNMRFSFAELEKTQFTNKNGVYQDGVLPFYRALDGYIYSLLGHSHLGGISLWRGKEVSSLKKIGEIKFDFSIGKAGDAFDGRCYPDGPKARGGIWIQGLFIDVETNTFYAIIHNETAWEAKETNYNVFGYNKGEPDYRHIGLIISKDFGRTWSFKDWIITSNKPCWSEYFAPKGLHGGQRGPIVCLGAGDSSLFSNPNDEFIYLFYTQIELDVNKNTYNDKIYVARVLKSKIGDRGSWEKYYKGAFQEPGNMGLETQILNEASVPCVSYNEYLGKYIMTSYHRPSWINKQSTLQMSFSNNLTDWTKPALIKTSIDGLSKPYFTICNDNNVGANNITNDKILLLCENNGEDVYKTTIKIL